MPKRPAALLALLSALPFVVGFSPPTEPGTHVSMAAGHGRFVSTPGCAHPRMVQATDQQVGAYHRWKPRGEWKTAYGLGAELDLLQSREKECTEGDCNNVDPGWSHTQVLSVLNAYGTIDWKWVGLQAGGRMPLLPGYGERVGEMEMITRFPLRGGLRLGAVDKVYLSLDVLTGQPTFSGSTFPIGIGGRLFGTDLWMAPGPDLDNLGVSGRISRKMGPMRLSLAGRWNPDEEIGDGVQVRQPEYGYSASLSYRLPF